MPIQLPWYVVTGSRPKKCYNKSEYDKDSDTVFNTRARKGRMLMEGKDLQLARKAFDEYH